MKSRRRRHTVRHNPLPPPDASAVKAINKFKTLDGMVDAARDADPLRWVYAAVEAMKLVYKTLDERSLLPPESDLAITVIDRMERWVETGSKNALQEFYDEVIGKKWEKARTYPHYYQQVEVTNWDHMLDLTYAKPSGLPRRLKREQALYDEIQIWFWSIFTRFYHSQPNYEGSSVLWNATKILESPLVGYNQRVKGSRARSGEVMIMSILAHAMTVP